MHNLSPISFPSGLCVSAGAVHGRAEPWLSGAGSGRTCNGRGEARVRWSGSLVISPCGFNTLFNNRPFRVCLTMDYFLSRHSSFSFTHLNLVWEQLLCVLCLGHLAEQHMMNCSQSQTWITGNPGKRAASVSQWKAFKLEVLWTCVVCLVKLLEN